MDAKGDGGAGQGSARLCRVIGRVTSSVGFPESCKRRLKLLVRSGVRVEGCRDRVGSSGIEEPCRCQKKSGRVPGWAAYTEWLLVTISWTGVTGPSYLRCTEVGT
jgi:hypothetical protein